MFLSKYLFLKVNFLVHNIYLNYLTKLVKNGHNNKAISCIEQLALLYSKKYIGLLASNRLENLLKDIGRFCVGSEGAVQNSPVKNNPLKVLHLATEFYDVGGHTRVVQDWIKDDLENQHEILLTDQKKAFNLKMKASIHFLNGKNYIHKAKKIRKFVFNNQFDKVIIHQHMHDVLPTLALWNFKENEYGIDTIFYVHSDFRFSLGNIVAKKRINYTKKHSKQSTRFRVDGVKDFHLPFALNSSMSESEKKIDHLKDVYNVKSYDKIFMVIGSSYKLKPYNNVNLLKEWNSFLKINNNMTLMVVGSDINVFNKFCPNETQSENLMLLGIIENPINLYKISDYVLNTYPISTGHGLYTALKYYSLPIFSYYGVLVCHNEVNDMFPAEFSHIMDYTTKDEYFEFIEKGIETKKLKETADKVLPEFIGSRSLKSWREQLYHIYNDNIAKYELPEIESNDQQNLILTQESLNWYNYSCDDKNSIVLLDQILRSKLIINYNYSIKIISLGLVFKPIYTSRLIFNKILKKVKKITKLHG